jgi:hypothetical protein
MTSALLISIPKKGDRQIDRDIGRALPFEQIAPILRGAVNHELCQTQAIRIVFLRDEIGRRDHAPVWMPHPHQRFGTAADQGAGIDLLLVP